MFSLELKHIWYVIMYNMYIHEDSSRLSWQNSQKLRSLPHEGASCLMVVRRAPFLCHRNRPQKVEGNKQRPSQYDISVRDGLTVSYDIGEHILVSL